MTGHHEHMITCHALHSQGVLWAVLLLRHCVLPLTDQGHSEQGLVCDKAGLLAVRLFAVWLSSSVLMMTNSGMSTCHEAGEA